KCHILRTFDQHLRRSVESIGSPNTLSVSGIISALVPCFLMNRGNQNPISARLRKTCRKNHRLHNVYRRKVQPDSGGAFSIASYLTSVAPATFNSHPIQPM